MNDWFYALAADCSISIAKPLEILQFYNKPSISLGVYISFYMDSRRTSSNEKWLLLSNPCQWPKYHYIWYLCHDMGLIQKPILVKHCLINNTTWLIVTIIEAIKLMEAITLNPAYLFLLWMLSAILWNINHVLLQRDHIWYHHAISINVSPPSN